MKISHKLNEKIFFLNFWHTYLPFLLCPLVFCHGKFWAPENGVTEIFLFVI